MTRLEVSRKARRRRAQVTAMRYNGMTFSQIGAVFGISRQRAHEILIARKK